MNIEYGIKNFRVFDKEGARFNLKPITMLTGANCAGKSSLVKSIMLLKQYLDKAINNEMQFPGAHNISFTDQSININGIDTVINKKSEGYKDVVFSISKKGATDNVKYIVEYTFSSLKGDYFNNGWLKSMRFACEVDGASDVFLHVEFDNNLPNFKFKVIDLSGNILKAYLRDTDLKTYLGYHLSDLPPIDKKDSSNYLAEKRCFDALVNRVQENPLNSSLPLYRTPRKTGKKREEIFDVVLLPSKELDRLDDFLYYSHRRTVSPTTLQQLHNHRNIFYLPVLERIGKKTVQELKSYLLDDELIKALFPRNDKTVIEGFVAKATVNNKKRWNDAINEYKKTVKALIEDFKSSGLKTFSEYYLSIANWQLANISSCESPIASYIFDVFLSTVSSRLSYPVDVPHSVNVLKTDANLEDGDVKIELTVFQKAYYVISCLQRHINKTDEVIGQTSDLLNQPQYELRDEATFVWANDDWSKTKQSSMSISDTPIPILYYNFVHYLNNIISSLCTIEDYQHISQYDSFLCPVRRSYSVYDKTPLNELLVEYIGLREQRKAEKLPQNVRFINKWVKTLGIGESILFELNKEKTDIKILVKTSAGEKISSADLGHGVTQMLSILINIERHILEKGKSETPYTICIEEPEVSLHPSWQSALGRIFYDAAVNYGIHFIIETHSEYLIRSSQLIVAQQKYKTEYELQRTNPFVVYYISKDKGAYDMQYLTSGRFARKFGTGFFDAASALAFGLYDIENSDK